MRHSITSTGQALNQTPVDVVYIDPVSYGIEETSKFIFETRRLAPEIVFVLHSDFDLVRDNEPRFYAGDRIRFRHYFTLDKSDTEGYRSAVVTTLHLCASDIRFSTSYARFVGRSGPPNEIRDSLAEYRNAFSSKKTTAFVVMQFGKTKTHDKIYEAISSALEPSGILAVRADGKRFHDDLFYNVLTYLHGCRFGIAVFERIQEDDFNPNVSLEVGYLLALRKPICFLKDQTLQALPTDLVGKLYTSFDPQDTKKTIRSALQSWIADLAFAEAL